MKRLVCAAFILLIAVTVMGCDDETAGSVEGLASSGGAVSGQAVTDEATEDEAVSLRPDVIAPLKSRVTTKAYAYRNSTDYYVPTINDGVYEMVQYRLNGDKVSSHSFDIDSSLPNGFYYGLRWVDDDNILYVDADNPSELRIVPIDKTSSGDNVLWDEDEVLLSTIYAAPNIEDYAIMPDGFAATDKYISFLTASGGFFVYDREKDNIIDVDDVPDMTMYPTVDEYLARDYGLPPYSSRYTFIDDTMYVTTAEGLVSYKLGDDSFKSVEGMYDPVTERYATLLDLMDWNLELSKAGVTISGVSSIGTTPSFYTDGDDLYVDIDSDILRYDLTDMDKAPKYMERLSDFLKGLKKQTRHVYFVEDGVWYYEVVNKNDKLSSDDFYVTEGYYDLYTGMHTDMTVDTLATETSESAVISDDEKSYIDYLLSGNDIHAVDDNGCIIMPYTFFDIDSDGREELIVTDDDTLYVYGIKEGEPVKLIDDDYDNDFTVYTDSHVIAYTYKDKKGRYEKYISIGADGMREEAYKSVKKDKSSKEGKKTVYKVYGKKCSKKRFDRYVKELKTEKSVGAGDNYWFLSDY